MGMPLLSLAVGGEDQDVVAPADPHRLERAVGADGVVDAAQVLVEGGGGLTPLTMRTANASTWKLTPLITRVASR
jgi:hypothetical protein